MITVTAMDGQPGSVQYLLAATGCAEHQEALRDVQRAVEAGDAVAYYASATQNGEAPGRWSGRGAEQLGYMPGDVADPDDVRKLLGGLVNPKTDQRLGSPPRRYKTFQENLAAALEGVPADEIEEKRREVYDQVAKKTQRNVNFYDLTFSAQKSVSVWRDLLLLAGEDDMAAEVGRAHTAGVEAARAYLEQQGAWIRRGKHKVVNGVGVGRREKGKGLVAVGFDHSTSRSGDPHLHTHLAVVNRTQSEVDDSWGALDAAQWRAIKGTMSAIYESTMEARIESATGARFVTREDGIGREIAGLPDELVQASSARTVQTAELEQQLLDEFRERTGREPTKRERKKIDRDAGLQSRARKSHATPGEQRAEWGARNGVDAAARVQDVLGAAEVIEVERAEMRRDVDVPSLVRQALAEQQAAVSTWNLGALTSRVSKRLAELGYGATEDHVAAWSQQLVGEVCAPDNSEGVIELTRSDPARVPDFWRDETTGRSVFQSPNQRIFATRSHLSTEQAIVARARREGARTVPVEQLRELEAEITSGPMPLGADQAAFVLGTLGSGRAGDVLVAAAGTGKSMAAGTLRRLWERVHDGEVVGVTTSQRAAQVLKEDDINALNSSRFLQTYDPTVPAGQSVEKHRLTNRHLIIVDEAGMASTREIDRIQTLAAEVGAKVVFQGDPEQLGPVGAGGMLGLLAEENGCYQLEEVRRFRNDWEGEASKRLRDGDTTALQIYEDHGRIVSGELSEVRTQAVRSYVADRLQGKTSLLVVGTNEEAAEVSRDVQDRLRMMLKVSGRELGTLMDGNSACEGDLIQARRNDWNTVAEDGRPLINRDMLTVTGLVDGQADAVWARREDGVEIIISRDYLREHCTLGYASTRHAAQGVTVDTCHALTSDYVSVTRGRDDNVMYVETQRVGNAEEPGLDTTPLAVLAQSFSPQAREQAAVQTMREEIAASDSLTSIAHYWNLTQGEIAEDRHAQAVQHSLGDEVAERLLVTGDDGKTDRSDGFAGLLTSMRRAELQGYDVENLLVTAVGERDFADADDLGRVLRSRFDRAVSSATPDAPRTWSNRAETVPGVLGEFDQELTQRMDDKVAELGEQLADDPPQWALKTIGPCPDEAGQRAEWVRRAGEIAGYREYRGIPDQQISVGAAPNPDDVVEYVWWQQAARAQGRPTDQLDYSLASDEELQAITGRWDRALAWAPMYAAYQQGQAHEAARTWRTEAALAADEAAHASDEDRERLQAAAEAAARTAERMAERAAVLDEAARVRAEWEQHTEAQADAARQAQKELEARGHGEDEATEVEVDQLELFTVPEQPETVPDQQVHDEPVIELEEESDAQLALVEVEPTARQDAGREAAEIDTGDVSAEVETSAGETLEEIRRRAAIAEQVIRQQREQKIAEEQARLDRARLDDEERRSRDAERTVERQQGPEVEV